MLQCQLKCSSESLGLSKPGSKWLSSKVVDYAINASLGLFCRFQGGGLQEIFLPDSEAGCVEAIDIRHVISRANDSVGVDKLVSQ
jgi:hypothetical protein